MQPVAVTLKLSRSKQDINSEEQEVYLLIGLAVECRSHLWVLHTREDNILFCSDRGKYKFQVREWGAEWGAEYSFI